MAAGQKTCAAGVMGRDRQNGEILLRHDLLEGHREGPYVIPSSDPKFGRSLEGRNSANDNFVFRIGDELSRVCWKRGSSRSHHASACVSRSSLICCRRKNTCLPRL